MFVVHGLPGPAWPGRFLSKFYVTISLCKVSGHTTDFISDNLNLNNFVIDQAVLSDSASCSYGNIVQANIQFLNPVFGHDGRSFTQACWN